MSCPALPGIADRPGTCDGCHSPSVGGDLRGGGCALAASPERLEELGPGIEVWREHHRVGAEDADSSELAGVDPRTFRDEPLDPSPLETDSQGGRLFEFVLGRAQCLMEEERHRVAELAEQQSTVDGNLIVSQDRDALVEHLPSVAEGIVQHGAIPALRNPLAPPAGRPRVPSPG